MEARTMVDDLNAALVSRFTDPEDIPALRAERDLYAALEQVDMAAIFRAKRWDLRAAPDDVLVRPGSVVDAIIEAVKVSR